MCHIYEYFGVHDIQEFIEYAMKSLIGDLSMLKESVLKERGCFLFLLPL